MTKFICHDPDRIIWVRCPIGSNMYQIIHQVLIFHLSSCTSKSHVCIICTKKTIFGTYKCFMGQNTPQFILNKLPVSIDKVETIATLKASAKAMRALGELKGVAQSIPNQSMLVNAAVLQESKDSSEIENIITTQDELYKALSTNKIVNSAVKEVVNYRKAIFFGFDLIKEKGFIRFSDLNDIQSIIVENNAGVRSTPGTVLKNDKTGELVYIPPQSKDEILELLTNFLDHFNTESDVQLLINLAVLHFQFESIHPYYDGNGRTGRILNILFLILNDLLDIPILYLSSYIIDHKPDYYRLLNQVNRTGEWEEWILYILKAVEETSNNTVQKINSIKKLLGDTIEMVKEKAPKVYRKELIELLFEQPYSKIDYVIEKIGVERKAASRYLKELESIGVLKSIKMGRQVIYVNEDLIEILRRD